MKSSDSTFYAGAAVRGIVPSPEMVNSTLHPNMNVRLDEQGSPLQVKALVMSFNDQHHLLLAIDTVGASQAHCRILRQLLEKATGISAQDIVVTASHSHSTPFLEPLDGVHPYFDFVAAKAVEAAVEARNLRGKARVGNACTSVAGFSFNTRVPLPNGGVKFARDFHEGLAAGGLVDPRLNVIRIDDQSGRPIAGWVRVAAHPACVIFNAPVSAEYPGYLTNRLSETVAGGAPVLFGYGASGDVNCIPMFGKESDAAKLGISLANAAAPVFDQIHTGSPKRFLTRSQEIELPLDRVPSVATLDKEIAEVEAFAAALHLEPNLEWVLGINCKRDWSIETKRAHVAPLAEWARRVKRAVEAGLLFPTTWPIDITAWIIDDLGLIFYPGEPLTALGLELNALSPLSATLLISLSNGSDAYLGTDQDRRRGGYELSTAHRYTKLAEGHRPLPYALGAGDYMLRNVVKLIMDLLKDEE